MLRLWLKFYGFFQLQIKKFYIVYCIFEKSDYNILLCE